MNDKTRTCASRKRGEKHKLEMGEDVANSLTTINTDSMVAEPSIVSYTRDKKGKITNHHLKEEANTLHTGGGNTAQYVLDGVPYRIRSLTPRECFRLMGVDDADIDKIQETGISRTRQVALAGNSIVVDVLAEIFRTLFDENAPENNESKPHQLTLF
jgi:DNA (cytosine-5)-methyltransferase 1